jgi:uncharacterized protein (TIGR02118 family)
MIKFVVNFRQPKDLEKFENSYNDFLALVERMPLIQRRQAIHVTGSPQGKAPYHRALEIYFATEADLRESLLSQHGQEAGNELGKFEQGGFDVYFAEVFEEAGGKTE